jgi:hypothetical protein
MSLFNQQDAKAIREHLAASLKRPVQLALFISERNCPTVTLHANCWRR